MVNAVRSKTGGCSMRIVAICCLNLFSLFSTFPAACMRADDAPRKIGMNEKPPTTISCRVSTERGWKTSGKAIISVVIENTAPVEVGLAAVPAFHLHQPNHSNPEWDYIALWDLDRFSLQVSSVVQLRIKAGGHRTAELDVSPLLWSRVDSALLPHSKLFDSVPKGKYLLWLDLTSADGTLLCSSPKVGAEIK